MCEWWDEKGVCRGQGGSEGAHQEPYQSIALRMGMEGYEGEGCCSGGREAAAVGARAIWVCLPVPLLQHGPLDGISQILALLFSPSLCFPGSWVNPCYKLQHYEQVCCCL